MSNTKKALLAVFVAIVLGLLVGMGAFQFANTTEFVNESLALENRLAIPKLLEPRIENGEKIFDLTAQLGTTEFFLGMPARTAGYNGSILGPTIRARKGDAVRINVTNNLGETTTVHWHGMRLPPAIDGGPHQVVAPGATWSPNWTITNEAATLWYHPHTMEKTAQQVYRGLAGLFIIDDANADSLDLPDEYGVDDIPLVVQDRKFDARGGLLYDHNHMMHMVTAGMLGNEIIVNGTRAPYTEVPATLVRLRLLNGSNARRFNFGFSDDRSFYHIASDGGFFEAPIAMTRVQLAPGERAEILVDLTGAREALTLMSYAVEGDTSAVRAFAMHAIAGGTDERREFKILELRPTQGNNAAKKIPQKLSTIESPNVSGAKERFFRLDSNAINGLRMDATRADAVVQKGAIEIWTLRNEAPMYHPIHVHGVQFQVLERNGAAPPAYEVGWKDTVSLNPAETVRLAVRMPTYSDPNVPYMFHCHILEHEDMGMMGQYVVVDDPSQPVNLQSLPFQSNQPSGEHMMHGME